MDFNSIKEEVKQILSEKRFKHSEGVVKRAIQLANIYGEDIEKVKLVAITHDIAKEMTKEESYKYIKENDIQIDEIERLEPSILHAKIGADICAKKYNFTKQMQDAIKYHTIGNVEMDKLAKIIFIADKTEEGRTCINLEQANEITNKNLDDGLLYVVKIAIAYTLEKNALMHSDTIDLINQLIKDHICNNNITKTI